MRSRGVVTLALGFGLVIVANVDAQCPGKQIQAGKKALRNLTCAKAVLPTGPPGPPGPPGTPGFGQLTYVDGARDLLANNYACATAECAPGARIVSCGSMNVNPTAMDVDPFTVLLGNIGFRDPEDDTPADLLSADTCVACYANSNAADTVTIQARAICATSGTAALQGGPVRRDPRPLGYPEVRLLMDNLTRKSR